MNAKTDRIGNINLYFYENRWTDVTSKQTNNNNDQPLSLPSTAKIGIRKELFEASYSR